MGIVAGFLIQNVLKYLLSFGTVSRYLGYNALLDFFPTLSMKPNPNCDDSFCVKRQEEFQKMAAMKTKENEVCEKVEEKVVHENNEWGISLVDESEPSQPDEADKDIVPGVRLAYSKQNFTQESENEVQETHQSLEELMEQMKKL